VLSGESGARNRKKLPKPYTIRAAGTVIAAGKAVSVPVSVARNSSNALANALASAPANTVIVDPLRKTDEP
jgi:hypothetical protein